MAENAGEYNRYIAIHKREPGKNTAGQQLNTWTLHKSKWSKVRGQTGMGSIRQKNGDQGVMGATRTLSFRIRGIDQTITTDMRIVYKGEFYDIQLINYDTDRNEWTDLVAETGGNAG